jgi:hypothetical protein
VIQTDRICGVEREKESPVFGELVVEEANLWAKPGGMLIPGNHIIGKVPHLTEVKVMNKKTINHYLFIEIKAVLENGAQVRGWMTASLLETLGAK